MFDLTGKTALVTGATGTIGGSIARALHAQGATVAISGTRCRCGMRRMVLVHFGIHQFASPRSFIRAGTRRARIL